MCIINIKKNKWDKEKVGRVTGYRFDYNEGK